MYNKKLFNNLYGDFEVAFSEEDEKSLIVNRGYFLSNLGELVEHIEDMKAQHLEACDIYERTKTLACYGEFEYTGKLTTAALEALRETDRRLQDLLIVYAVYTDAEYISGQGIDPEHIPECEIREEMEDKEFDTSMYLFFTEEME